MVSHQTRQVDNYSITYDICVLIFNCAWQDLVARSGFFGLNNQISQDDRREESRLTGKKIERLSELLVDTREVDVDAVLQEAEERDPAGYTCMNKVMLIKEVEHEEEVHCRHVSHEICHVVSGIVSTRISYFESIMTTY